MGCKFNILIDVTDAGGIIFNYGRMVERSDVNRSRNTERRLPIVGARRSLKYKELFEENAERLLEDFMEREESNCLLDLVKNDRSYTLEETGDRLNITRERVRQIESKGLKHMESSPHQKEMKEWLEA